MQWSTHIYRVYYTSCKLVQHLINFDSRHSKCSFSAVARIRKIYKTPPVMQQLALKFKQGWHLFFNWWWAAQRVIGPIFPSTTSEQYTLLIKVSNRGSQHRRTRKIVFSPKTALFADKNWIKKGHISVMPPPTKQYALRNVLAGTATAVLANLIFVTNSLVVNRWKPLAAELCFLKALLQIALFSTIWIAGKMCTR